MSNLSANDLLKKVRKIEIKTRALSHQIFAGEYHSAFKGRGMAFSEVREYQYGDDVRNMDWNVTARLRSPYVKVFEEERELTVVLLVDVSRSRLFGTAGASRKDILAEIEQHGREHFPTLTDADIAVMEEYVAEGKYDGHGGFCETALVYGTHPKTVAPERFEAECGLSTHRADFLQNEKISFGYSWASNYPNHLNGLNPVGCTEAIGKAMVKITAERLARIFKMLKEDDEDEKDVRSLTLGRALSVSFKLSLIHI